MQHLSQLKAGAAVLLVKNAALAVEHYRDKLGFQCVDLFGDPPEFAILQRDDCFLMLAQVAAGKSIIPNWELREKTCSVYFWVRDADALCEELKNRGAHIDYGPCTQPYGCREFGVQDLDGHDIAFGTRVAG